MFNVNVYKVKKIMLPFKLYANKTIMMYVAQNMPNVIRVSNAAAIPCENAKVANVVMLDTHKEKRSEAFVESQETRRSFHSDEYLPIHNWSEGET